MLLDPERLQIIDHYLHYDPQANPKNHNKLVLPSPIEHMTRYASALHRQSNRLRQDFKVLRKERLDRIRKNLPSDEEIDGFDPAVNAALQNLNSGPQPETREILAIKKNIFNLFTEDEKVTDPYPKPYHKDYGFDWEASIFRGYVHDWCGFVNKEGNCVTYPTPRFTVNHKERWPYCPDGSPREFRERNGHTTFGPRLDTELPPSLPRPSEWGAPANGHDIADPEPDPNKKKEEQTKPPRPGKRY